MEPLREGWEPGQKVHDKRSADLFGGKHSLLASF